MVIIQMAVLASVAPVVNTDWRNEQTEKSDSDGYSYLSGSYNLLANSFHSPLETLAPSLFLIIPINQII